LEPGGVPRVAPPGRGVEAGRVPVTPGAATARLPAVGRPAGAPRGVARPGARGGPGHAGVLGAAAARRADAPSPGVGADRDPHLRLRRAGDPGRRARRHGAGPPRRRGEPHPRATPLAAGAARPAVTTVARRAAGRAASQGHVGALQGILPHRLLRTVRHDARRVRDRVPLPVPSALRPAQRGPWRCRDRAGRLARRPAMGDAGHHPARRVAQLRLQHADLRLRAAAHSGAAVRGGGSGRRRRLGVLSVVHSAPARAHVRVRGRDHGHRLLPAVRRAVRHDRGRTAQEHAQHGALHVRGGVPLVAPRLRRGHRLRAVLHHPGLHARPAAPAARGAMTRRLQQVSLYGALVVGAAVTLVPLVWMVSASLMPTGQATTYPPRFFPRAVTFEHYAELFTRLSLGRYVLNSSIVALAATLLSLLFNSMAGYALAKLRFRGRDGLFRLLVAGLVIPAQVPLLPLVALANLAGEHVQDTELMMAGSVLTVLPVLLLFVLLQRYYIEGIMAGSTKG